MTPYDADSPLGRLQYADVLAGFLGCVIDRKDQSSKTGARSNKPRAIVLNPNSPKGSAAKYLVETLRNPNISDLEIWEELQWLSENYGCFEVNLNKKRSTSDAEWSNAKLYFNDSAEELVRSWLGRPYLDSMDEQWGMLLDKYVDCFESSDELLSWRRPMLPAGYDDYEALVLCWAEVGKTLQRVRNITWRQLSAKCFFSDSKFLDSESNQSQVRRFFPNLCDKIVARPILLHVYLPDQIRGVVIIENQDTFTELADLRPQNLALVYGAGYKAGAKRIRSPGIPNFSLYGCHIASERLVRFERWWVEEEAQDWTVFFWGDLDYSGLDIAASLKASFSGLECWRPGYVPMLKSLKSGRGHLPVQAGKARQRAVHQIGCAFADETLLPALELSGRLVDQEVVNISEVVAEIDL